MAIKMKTTVTLKATGTCTSHSRSDIAIRDLVFAIDEPAERGGTNAGPTPTDTALSALIGCTNVIGHKCASKMGIDIGDLTINATCGFDRRGVTLEEEIEVPFASVTLDVAAHGSASADELAHVAIETEKYCPLSKLFRNAGTHLEVHWHKA